MALQETNKNASLKCLEKGTVWLLSPNDYFFLGACYPSFVNKANFRNFSEQNV